MAFSLVVSGGTFASAGEPAGGDVVDVVEEVADGVLDDAVATDVLDGDADSVIQDEVSGTAVDIPVDPSGGVVIGDGDAEVAIALPFADQADDAVVADGVVSYDNNNGSQTLPVVKEDGALQILTTIEGPDSPTAYDYAMDLPEGASLLDDGAGGVLVVDGDEALLGWIDAAWAIDANGEPVATHYEIDGATLIQVVETDEYTAYPVVADPKYYWWGVRFTLSSRQATQLKWTLAGGAGALTIASLGCTATFAGALPCGLPVGIAAVIVGLGGAVVGACNKNSRGTYIYVTYAGQAWCRSR
ncbi:hypothetical protein [Demequina capsici]|uniref:Uncharacterized protein n=1 Tax=Demequina capsici TaxID=3075620 RepID=A0AA96F6W2_9MICO|nr:hypothetical protein [Demequina sp. OYTSA14]WNM25176.1 hypothetical protein RN606_03240 [Demequina sp. OYTSA14]